MKKSDYNHIDGLFQDHLLTHVVEVNNPDRLWSRIKNDSSKRRYYFILFGMLLGACGLLLSSQNVDMAGGGGTSSEVTAMIPDQQDSRNQNSEQKKGILKNDDDLTLEKQGDNQDEGVSVNILDNEMDVLETSKIFHSHNSAYLNESTHINVIDEANSENDRIPNHLKGSIHNLENPIGIPPNSNAAILTEDQYFELESLHVTARNKAHEMVGVETIAFSIDNVLPALPEMKNGRMEKCEIGASSGGLYIDLYSNFSLPFDNVRLNDGFQDQVTYRDTWNERNNTLLSISGGLSMGYEFGSGLDLSLGMEYQKMESQYSYTQTINEITTVYDPMAYFFVDDQGQTVWVADSVTAINRYDRTVSFGSTTTLINIPLQVSYPIVRKGRWEIKAAASGILNVTMRNKGQALREDLMLQAIDDSNASTFYKSSIGISYELGLHFGYHLNDHLEMYASTRFRYNPTSYLLDTSPLHLSRSFGGLRIGTQYHF